MRLFFALPLPGEAKEALRQPLEEARKAGGDGVGFTRIEQLHFTLAFLGEQPAADEALAAGEALTQTAAFEIAISASGAFPSSRRPRLRGLLRSLEPLRTPPGAEIELRPGERLINFSSNDYLGLAGEARIAQALAEGARAWGAGAGASRLVCGDFIPEHDLELELAQFSSSEAALLFPSGYAANCGIVPAFAGPADLILSDALNP